jgi:hypothetical protein
MNNSIANQYGLTCNFTLQGESLSLSTAFQSDNGGMNWGGAITIQTPASAGPIVTGLWDSDGNVFFTIYLSNKGLTGPNCVINSGANPVSYVPDIQVWSQNGLECQIISNGEQDGEYNYTLDIVISNKNNFSSTQSIKQRVSEQV